MAAMRPNTVVQVAGWVVLSQSARNYYNADVLRSITALLGRWFQRIRR